MIFKRIFRPTPKWQHTDPEVRRQAVSSIPAQDQDTLIQLACHDDDPAVRRQACRRLKRLDLLHQLATQDPDAGVREFAVAYLRNLLCGQDPQSPSLEARLAELGQLQDQRLLEQVATGATDAVLRRAAIERLERGESLLERALGDGSAANRLAAAQRLHDRALLEHLAQRIGKKDKNVYRVVHQRLREFAKREAAPARLRAECTDLCERAERLGRLQNWSQDRALLEHLERQWSGLAGLPEPALVERFQAARQRFLDAYEAYRRENSTQIAAEEARLQGIERRTTLIESLRLATTGADEAALLAARERMEKEWQALSPLPPDDERRLDKERGRVHDLASAHLAAIAAKRQRAETLADLLRRTQTLRDATAPLEHQALAELRREVSALGEDGDTPELQQQLSDTLSQLRERFDHQRQHAEQRLAQLPAHLEELEAHLDAGELRKAEPLAQGAQTTLALLAKSGINRRHFGELERRLHGLAPRLRALQHWRKWGADQHRAALCERLSALLSGEQNPAHLADRLHEAQAEWRRLDQSGTPVNRPLWERFHAIAEQIYALCRPYLEQQTALREQHRLEREALCCELEQFLDQVDWARVDWKKAVRAERQMRAAWAGAGRLEGRQRRELERRFHAAIERLDAHLGAERERNRELKRGLIAQVEALAETEDLHQAIEETKRLQSLWHTSVPGRPGQENRLWQRFRRACDAIFARRHAAAEARGREAEENLHSRRAICEELNHLSSLDLGASELEQAFAELRERWAALAHREVPPKALPGLEKAWRDAQATGRATIERAHQDRERRELDLLRQRAHLCAELEALASTGTVLPKDLEPIQAAWAVLPPLRARHLTEAIAARFARTAEGGHEDLARRCAENLKKREELCLRLEILAGIDSPAGLAAERLAFQVSRLSEHLRDGTPDLLEGAEALEIAWYLSGPAPTERAAGLELRFERARSALRGAQQGERPAAPAHGPPPSSAEEHG